MKIEIHDSTYIFLLLSFFSGYFEYMYILLLIIFIHESGHYFLAIINNIKISKLVIYPFGGITILESDLNTNIKKEMFVLLGGIIFQVVFIFFVKQMYINTNITKHIYDIFTKINYILMA